MNKVELLVLSASLLALPLTTFASTKDHKNITFDEPVRVASTQLKPGTYKMEWKGNGPNTEVSFIQNGKNIVTAPAELVKETTVHNEAIETHKTLTGSNRLDQVDLKNVALNFRGRQTNQGGA